jgi:hypothetical protein
MSRNLRTLAAATATFGCFVALFYALVVLPALMLMPQGGHPE